MSEIVSREVRLKQRPVGIPKESNFEIAEVMVDAPQAGEVLVRNIYMSVDPYMRGVVRNVALGAPLEGGCVGQVVQSGSESFQVGDYVLGGLGWREYYLAPAQNVSQIDPTLAPIQSFVGAVGMPGRTAYFGLLDIGEPKAGEMVFVSAASGAVGAIVCQIAKIKGCRVVASAGSDQKVNWLLEKAGVDAAFNYKRVDNLVDELKQHCPDGIDIYFENVGGAHLEAALSLMNMHGRIPLCGMIAHYNDVEPTPGPRNLSTAIGKRLKLQGFIVTDYADRTDDFYADMRRWISEGKIHWEETIVEGLENAPQAFIGLFKGENMGKMIVKIGPEETV